jgi:hypothetical protein
VCASPHGALTSPLVSPTTEREKPRRPTRPPETGWELGAGGLTKASWATLAVLLVALAIFLLASGYIGYGGIILILAGAAAVNLL